MASNAREVQEIVCVNVPQKMPNPNEDFAVRAGKALDTDALDDNDVLCELSYASVDPYLRGRMAEFNNKGNPSAIYNFGLGKVLEVGKNVKTLKPGDWTQGYFPWQNYFILPSNKTFPVPTHVPKYVDPSSDNKDNSDEKAPEMIDISSIEKASFIGQFGMPGMTAYYGLFDKANLKSTDTLLVSGGAGAVGLMVGQIAKAIGCKKIVGTAGTQEKLDYMKSVGFTDVINYKENNDAQSMTAALKAAFGDGGIDVYFDNTGGNVTNCVWDLMNQFGRVAVCGQIAYYNSGGDVDPITPFLSKLIYKEISIRGLVYMNFKKHQEFYSRVGEWVINGQIELRNTVVKGGLDDIPQAFCDLFVGKNIGKLVVDLTK